MISASLLGWLGVGASAVLLLGVVGTWFRAWIDYRILRTLHSIEKNTMEEKNERFV